MILSNEKIQELMKTPSNGDAVTKGALLQKQHKLHVTGEGYKDALKQVEGYEGKNDFNIRNQVAKPATIQITSIILDNLNRWITAQGTVKKVDFKDPDRNKKFGEVLSQVWRGDSFDNFITTFYKEAIYTEFNGFAIVTKPKIIDREWMERDGVIVKRKEGNLNPYIIFVTITDIYDFYITGEKVEYLIIKIGDKSYRLIDDEKDIVFDWDGDKIELMGAIPNELGYVPARRISSIKDNILSSQVSTTPIGHIIPALDRYFSCDADLRMQFIRHNYPKLAIVVKDCTICNGTGKCGKENEDGVFDLNTQVRCTTCDGSGKVIPISRDGVIGLPEYIRSDDSAYPGAPASYITPDTESLKLASDDLLAQRQNIIYSGTGDKNLISESLNTATENLINSRSLEDRIKEITQMVEAFETFLKKAIKELHNDFKSIEDYMIVVRYGKRISIKNEDELLQEMKSSKEAGMPTSYIAALHKDLIYSKYKNNVQELDRQILLADIEPLAGYTIKDLSDVKDYILPRDLQVKINFDSLVSELEQTTPIQYFMEGARHGDKVKAINKKIDEILEERLGADNTGGGQTLEEDDPDGPVDRQTRVRT